MLTPRPSPKTLSRRVTKLGVIGLVTLFFACGESLPPTAEQRAFDAADQGIFSFKGQEALGNTPEAQQRAQQFSTRFKVLRELLFTESRRNGLSGLSLTEGHFLTHCEMREGSVVLLIHVPELRKFKKDASKLLLDAAWSTARGIFKDLPSETTLAIGLRGIASYGESGTGPLSADEPATRNLDVRTSFPRFFTAAAFTPAVPTPEPTASTAIASTDSPAPLNASVGRLSEGGDGLAVSVEPGLWLTARAAVRGPGATVTDTGGRARRTHAWINGKYDVILQELEPGMPPVAAMQRARAVSTSVSFVLYGWSADGRSWTTPVTLSSVAIPGSLFKTTTGLRPTDVGRPLLDAKGHLVGLVSTDAAGMPALLATGDVRARVDKTRKLQEAMKAARPPE